MVNDASPGSKEENVVLKIVVANKNPHICMFAKRDIEIGEELRYDYNDPNLPWRKVNFGFRCRFISRRYANFL